MRIFLVFSLILLLGACKGTQHSAQKIGAGQKTGVGGLNTNEQVLSSRKVGPIASVPSTLYDLNASVIPVNKNEAQALQIDLRNIAGDVLFFETNSAQISRSGLLVVDSIARWMSQNPNGMIRLEGHADERGTRELNFALGEQRANAVRNALVARGIPAVRLETMSYGKERPLNALSDPDAWAKNRRVHVRILAS